METLPNRDPGPRNRKLASTDIGNDRPLLAHRKDQTYSNSNDNTKQRPRRQKEGVGKRTRERRQTNRRGGMRRGGKLQWRCGWRFWGPGVEKKRSLRLGEAFAAVGVFGFLLGEDEAVSTASLAAARARESNTAGRSTKGVLPRSLSLDKELRESYHAPSVSTVRTFVYSNSLPYNN